MGTVPACPDLFLIIITFHYEILKFCYFNLSMGTNHSE